MPVSSPNPPHELQLVLDFVNTRDVETGGDDIGRPAALHAWLRERGLLGTDAAVNAREHRDALALRESLRRVMLAHNGGGEDADAMAQLERAARQGELAVHFGADGSIGPQSQAGGVDGALARLLVPVVHAAGDGSWARAKACHADDCQWAFYDTSRNRSGRWCDMAVCGNRHKVRTYRARH